MAYFKAGSLYFAQNSNVVVDTASGAIANFQTPLAMPLLKTRFDFKATQDLHGYDYPWPAGGSAQKWDEVWELGSIDNQTGQNANDDNYYRSKNYIQVPQGENLYLFNGKSDTLGLRFYDSNKDFISSRAFLESKVMTYGTYDLPTGTAYIRFINTSTNVYKNNISVNYPSTDTAYHPYSNICPIDGVSEVKLGYVDFNQLMNLRTGVQAGITATMDSNNVITLSGTTLYSFTNITENMTPVKGHIYIIGKTVIDNPNNIAFLWRPLNATHNTITASTDTKWSVIRVTSETAISTTGLTGFQANTNLTGIKIKLLCIDLTQAFGEQIANYLWSLPDNGLSLAKQLLTKDYYPYNAGGSMVTLDSVNGEPTSQNAVINLGDTYYGGEVIIDKDGKRKIKAEYGKIVIDGSQSIRVASSAYIKSDACDCFVFENSIRTRISPAAQPNKFAFCEQLKPVKEQVWSEVGYANCMTINSNQIHVNIANELLGVTDYTQETEQTVSAKLKAYLTNNPITVVFIITPTLIDLPDGAVIKSIPAVNNIFCDTGETAVKFRKIGE